MHWNDAFLVRRAFSDSIRVKALTQNRLQSWLYLMLVGAIGSYCEIRNHSHDSFRDHGHNADSPPKSLARMIRDNMPLLSKPEAGRRRRLNLDVKLDVALWWMLTYSMLRLPVGDRTEIACDDDLSSFRSFLYITV
jgi:hypothetical protein